MLNKNKRIRPYKRAPASKKAVQTLNKWVMEQLRERILEGPYMPGESLTESRLMADLKVGRTPVREALRQLEVEGLVTIIPRKGATVNKVSLKDVEEAYLIQGDLEGLAASLSVARMNKETLNKLVAKIHESKRMQAANDIRNYCKVNREFHQILIERCGNDRLIKLIESLHRPIYRFRLISFAVPGRVQGSIEEHGKILQCVRRGDAAATRRAVEEHWNHTKEMLMDYLQEFSVLSSI